MKIVRRIGIGVINKLPSILKWSLFNLSFFKKRFRIDFSKTRNSLLSKNVKILVIGANDGLSFDDLFQSIDPREVSGAVIEPSSKYFAILQSNLKTFHKLNFVKAAIFKESKTLKLYQLNELGLKKLPDWGQGLGSFSKDHLLKFDGVKNEDIEFEYVDGIPFQRIIEKYSLTNLDYLQIDTEGFDAEIIKMIDFGRVSLRMIKFEIKNLDKNDMDMTSCLLKKKNYHLVKMHGDMVAYSKSINPFFT